MRFKYRFNKNRQIQMTHALWRGNNGRCALRGTFARASLRIQEAGGRIVAEIQQIAREDLSRIELKNTTQSQRSCCNRQVVCSYLGTTVSSIQVAFNSNILVNIQSPAIAITPR